MEKNMGAIFAAISAAGFGFLPIFAGLAYDYGANPTSVLAVRFTSAALIFWGIVFIKRLDFRLKKEKIIFLILLGALGYNSTTAAYFQAFNMISASLVSLIFYTNPIIVTVLSYLVFKEKITRNKALALIISSTGLILIVGFSIGQVDIKGMLMALLAAFLYSIYIITGGKAVEDVDPILVSTYVTSGCAIMVNIFGLFTNSLVNMVYQAWIYSILTALFSTVLAILMFYEAMKRIGPSQLAIISTIEPVVTVIMAAILLNDRITLPQMFGGFLVILGIIVLESPKKEETVVIPIDEKV